jgi:hypothetical protein
MEVRLHVTLSQQDTFPSGLLSNEQSRQHSFERLILATHYSASAWQTEGTVAHRYSSSSNYQIKP